MKLKLLIVFSVLAAIFSTNAQNFWDGVAADGKFSSCSNWSSNTCPSIWNSATDLNFQSSINDSQTSLYFDLSGWQDVNDLLFDINYTKSTPVNGDGNGFNIYGKIENNSNFPQTINVPISFKGNAPKINALKGPLNFTSTVANDSSNPLIIDAKHVITFSGDITGSAGVTINNTANIVYSGVSKTYTGTTIIENNATLRISSNQTLENIVIDGTLQIDSGVTLTITGTYSSITGTIDNKGTIKFAGGPVDFPGDATVNNGTANTLTSVEVASPAALTLSSSFSVEGIFTVSSGGVLGFNGFDILGSGKFTLATTGTLKITSADGVNVDGNSTGNVQCKGSRTFSQTGYYHYVGSSSPQFTGTAMTSGSTAKQIVINKTNATDIVNLTQGTGTAGFLQISKGIFVESATSAINGSGDLIIDSEGVYKIALTGNTVPQLSGKYTLFGNSTLELNGAGVQELRGSKSYRNLIFSNSGTKTLSSAITGENTIIGTVTIKDAAILDVENKSFGGNGTNLTMTGTSEFKTAGTGVKPDIAEIYSLGIGTKISFTNVAGTLESIRLKPVYYNIDVVGSSVGTDTATGALDFQSGGTLRVKNTGVFKLSNTTGFSGGTSTAINNVNNPTIILEPGSTIEYAKDGTNGDQTITPFLPSYQNLTISGTGEKKAEASSIIIGKDLNIKAAKLTIGDAKTFVVTNSVNNSGGIFNIENNGSLIQINTVSNSGNITYNRKSNTSRNTDYTYWSTPVTSSQTFANLFPQTLNGKYYSYEVTAVSEDWKQETSSSTMTVGKGYIVRGPEPNPPAVPSSPTASFLGVPNNGTYTISNIFADKFYLLGNPYPSALNADQFLTDNAAVLDGTLYFWTHNTVIQLASNITNNTAGTGTYAYTSDDYASYNLTGGVGTGNTVDGVEQIIYRPTGKIATGVGFFALSKAVITSPNAVVFNNGMRVGSNNSILDNSQFFKTRNSTKKTALIEKHRIWLNLKNTQGAFKQTLIGYITDATNQYDNRFDGESFDGNEFVDFYSLNQDKNLVIQGRALPFDENDQVSLGFRTTIDGAFTISIDDLDGLLTNQSVFIQDKLLNTMFDLKSGNYTFNTAAGTFNNRFVLRYTNKNLGTIDLETIDNQVLVSNKNKQIKINSKVESIDKVMVYDLLGRLLFKKEKVNSKEVRMSNLDCNQPIVLVKVYLQNGQQVTQKIVY